VKSMTFQKNMDHEWDHQRHYPINNHQSTEPYGHAVTVWARQKYAPDDLAGAKPQYREALVQASMGYKHLVINVDDDEE